MTRHVVVPSVVVAALLAAPFLVFASDSPVAPDTLQAAAAKAAPQTAKPAQPAKPAEPAKPATPAKPAEPAKRPAAAKASTPGKPPTFHFNAYGMYAYQQFAAKDSFKAVFGSSSSNMFGAGAQVSHRSGLFVQGEFSKMSDTGERVFVSGGQIYPLGIPVSLDLGYLDVGIGYKFLRKPKVPKAGTPPAKAPGAPAKPAGKPGDDGILWQQKPAAPAAPAGAGGPAQPTGPARPAAPVASAKPAPGTPSRFRITPYLGAGFGRASYKETSDFAQGDDNVSEGFPSYHVFAGVEWPITKLIGVNVEGFYRRVPDALGDNGVSKEFNEKDLGGPALRVKVTIGR